MVYRPALFNAESFALKKSQYAQARFIYGPNSMNITQPLSRASSVAEINTQRLYHEQSMKQSSIYRGFQVFPRIPRPKRSVFYYSTWSKGSKKLKIPGLGFKRSLSSAPASIRNKTQKVHRRFFSAEARRRRREKRRFMRWWTLTSIAVVLGGVAAKIRYERALEDDYDDEDNDRTLFNQYTIKPQSWQLYAYSTLPLKAISRLWGQVNSIQLPVWLRSPSYRLYSSIFGVNLDEMDEPDLTTYNNLSEFFYRKLKPGVRPLADSDLVSPSDGKVLKFGVIENGEIEQVKGMTYSIDALLGLSTKKLAAPVHSLDFDYDASHEAVIKRDEEFAKLNGISYTLDDLIGGESENAFHMNHLDYKDKGDGTAKEAKPSMDKDLSVAHNLTPTPLERLNLSQHTNLYFAVIYLAPGDYHRYHSPTNWVTTLRRHFIGELFSVAPFFQKTLQGLFVLNERVALLGYWKYGFFSMIPVGATNVGSIVVNFDKDLKTNDVYEHEVYRKKLPSTDSSDESVPLLSSDSELSVSSASSTKPKRLKKNTVYEATYTRASSLLGGYPLTKGEEVGGFRLGSTVVLVFEAPDNFRFNLEVGQKIKMGESLGEFA